MCVCNRFLFNPKRGREKREDKRHCLLCNEMGRDNIQHVSMSFGLVNQQQRALDSFIVQ